MISYIFLYSIMVYGISNALVYFNGPFDLIDKFRNWVGSIHPTFEDLFSCMFCMPTNVGLILSTISLLCGAYFTPFLTVFATYPIWCKILGIFFDGMYAGAITYLIHTIQQRIEKKDDETYVDEKGFYYKKSELPHSIDPNFLVD